MSLSSIKLILLDTISEKLTKMKIFLLIITIIVIINLSMVGCTPSLIPAPSPAPTPPLPTPVPSLAPTSNNPPDAPIIPSGSASGQTGTSYTYYTSSTDPEGDNVKYIFSWGDGSESETGFLGSGTTGNESHTWSSPGIYFVRVRSVDSHGAFSEWSDIKEITINVKTTIRTHSLTTVISPPGSGSVTPDAGQFETGTSVELTAQPNSGYIFDHWGGDVTGNSISINIAIESDMYIIAYFVTPPKVKPILQWSKTFGGEYADGGRSVQQIDDGSFIICGYTYSYGAGLGDVYLIKSDSNGKKVWEQTFGGAKEDSGFSIQKTVDRGYIIVGDTRSYESELHSSGIWLIKTDSSGQKSWDKTFGGGIPEWGWSVQQTTDEGYIITGTVAVVGNDVILLKTDSSGNQLWYKTFSGGSDRAMSSVQQTRDGGYIIISDALSDKTGFDIWLIKTDSHGNKEWDRTLGGVKRDAGLSIQQTSDGGYIIAGETESYGAGNADVWVIKTDSAGYKMWDQTFGGVQRDAGLSIQQTSDGGYVIAGETESYGAGNADVWVLKLSVK